MATATVNSDTVKLAIDQVFDILGALQTQLGAERGPKTSRWGSEPIDCLQPDHSNMRSGVDAHWYASKCRELDSLTQKYEAKCRDYDSLLARYTLLQTQQQQQDQRAARPTTMMSRQNEPRKIYTFDDFDEMERRMSPHYNGGRAKRTHAAVAAAGPPAHNVTPTKRARKAPNGIGKLELFSSPPLAAGRAFGSGSAAQGRADVISPLAPRTTRVAPVANTAAPAATTAAPARAPKDLAAGVKYSSQETQLDFSEADLRSEIGVELCPATDDEDDDDDEGAAARRREAEQAAQALALARAAELRRILDAVGGCAECRAFYTTPGLALPKRDASTLCKHRRASGKGAGKACTPSPAPATPAARAAGSTAARPSSERRPSTPENFWDIDYFPAIRTAGPEVLRKSKR